MIVATVGHVDHGKTALVKALTGVDTDRLPEEKTRGMSIDLGFAYRRAAGGGWLGFVDVPGHERFVRNMVAGVCGIDLALIVVAADDGVMPQTREHLAILDLLGVRRGAVVITKADRVRSTRIEHVCNDVQTILTGTLLAGAPSFRTAPTRGDGIPALLRYLEAQVLQTPVLIGSSGPARLAIDRAFTVAGHGTVVTGAVFDGCIALGDELMVSPSGMPARVRRIRIHDEDVSSAVAGERCALNLAGIDLEHVARGHWVMSAALHRPTSLLEVKLRLLPDASRILHTRQPLQFHLGTVSVAARATATSVHVARSSEDSFARLCLDDPIGAMRGDRFIIRDPCTRRTLGGGVVLDPFASPGRSKSSSRTARLRALDQPTPDGVLRELALLETGFVDLDWFQSAFKLSREGAYRMVESAGLLCVGKAATVAVSRARLEELCGSVVLLLAKFHREQPSADAEQVSKIADAIPAALRTHCFQAALDSLVDRGLVHIESSRIRLSAHEVAWGPGECRLWDRVRPKLAKCGWNTPRTGELARRLKVEEAELVQLLYRKMSQGELLKVGHDRFMRRETMAHLAAIAARVARAQSNERFTAAQFRDAVGTGRALAIDLLECLDRRHVTVRSGDFRRLSMSDPAVRLRADVVTGSLRHNWRDRHRFSVSVVLA